MAELEVNSLEEAKEKLKEIDPEGKLPKPSPEEVKAAYEEFAKAVSDFNNKTFELGKVEETEEIANYLLNFIERKVFWTKQGWMGVLKLNEDVKLTKDKAQAENKPFSMGYQALEFTYFALENVGGIGIASALDMEKEAELYAKVHDLVANQLQNARNELKEIQFLQNKWAAYEQGFYYEREPAEPIQEDLPADMQLPVEVQSEEKVE